MTSARCRYWSRLVLAGPVVFVCATLVMCSGALWLPKGSAQIDNIVLPIVMFPAIWALLLFYACLDRNLGRAWSAIAALGVVHIALIAAQLMIPGGLA